MQVLAFSSRKGGVGKSTSAANVAAALADRGRRVLLVDIDTSSALARAFGRRVDPAATTLTEVLLDGRGVGEALLPLGENLVLLPGDERLAVAASELPARDRLDWHARLAETLEGAGPLAEIAIVDTPPSLDTLTLLAMTAAGALLIPTQIESASAQAVRETLRVALRLRGDGTRRAYNPDLRVLGILPTFGELRTRHSRRLLADIHAEFAPLPVWEPIPFTVRVRESVAAGVPVVRYAPDSTAALAYRRVAARIEEALGDART